MDSILRAALETIAEKKISGTRMRLIAERAGMSQGNLHYYFPTKTDLFLALLDDMLAQFVEEREAWLTASEQGPPEKLAAFIAQKEQLLLGNRSLMQAYYDFWVRGTADPAVRAQFQHMYDTWRADIERVVQEGVAQGVFDPRGAPEAPALLVALMEGAAMQYLIDSERFNLHAHFRAAKEMVFRLLLAAPAPGGIRAG
jgi:AcrR family transcriptional regulator